MDHVRDELLDRLCHGAGIRERLASIVQTDSNAPNADIDERTFAEHMRQLPAFKEHPAGEDALAFFWRALAIPEEVADSQAVPPAPSRQSAPSWCVATVRALDDGADAAPSPFTGEPLLDYLRPLVAPAVDRASAAWRASSRVLDIDDESLERLVSRFARSLEAKASQVGLRAAVLEMHLARETGALEAGWSEARYREFAEWLATGSGQRHMLTKYPAVARSMRTAADNLLDAHTEFISRLVDDLDDLRAMISRPLAVRDVEDGLGDSHCMARTVIRVDFAGDSPTSVVYKPRSLGLAEHYYELYQAITDDFGVRHLLLSGGIPWTMARADYGWMQFVPRRSCSTADEVGRYFYRLGQHLALFVALGASDMHNENLIAWGEYPVPIDLETVLRVNTAAQSPAPDKPTLSRPTHESVFEIGLLPRKVWGSADHPGIDMTVLGGHVEQELPFEIEQWLDPGTDLYRLELAPFSMERDTPSVPRLSDSPVRASEYVDEAVAGFTAMYGCIATERDLLLNSSRFVARMRDDIVRYVPRSTAIYSELLRSSYHPDFLSSGVERDAQLGALIDTTDCRSWSARLFAAELEALDLGDIPFFTVRAGDRLVVAPNGDEIDDVVVETPLDYVARRIARFDERDCEVQAQLIRDAILASESRPGPSRGEGRLRSMAGSRSPRSLAHPSSAPLLDAAVEIGQGLCRTALVTDERARWIAPMVVADESYELGVVGHDLYRGAAGIALFLTYLGVIGDDPAAAEIGEMAWRTVMDAVEADLISGIGLFDGVGGLLYAARLLENVAPSPQLVADIAVLEARVLETLDASAAGDVDVTSGAAGLLLAARTGRLISSRPQAQLAVHLAGVIVEAAVVRDNGNAWSVWIDGDHSYLSGFAHGTSGIVSALASSEPARQLERCHDVTLGALEYESATFDHDRRNWRDQRFVDRGDVALPETFGFGWCHGAPGVLLGRSLLMREGVISSLGPDAEEAVRRIDEQEWFGAGHNLCHGGLGNAAVLSIVAEVTERKELQAMARDMTSLLVQGGRWHGWLPDGPPGTSSLGLMTGTSGIGWAALRAAAPSDVPNVLLAELPNPG